jgi:sulfotransferase family protein
LLSGQRLVLRTYFSAAARIRQVDRVVEKSPRHAMFVDLLASAYPRARMLYLHRHPVDTFSSYRRRAETDGEFAGIDAGQFVSGWRRRLRYLLDWQRRHPDRLLVIGYEELVEDPERTLRRILDFVGEEWDPAVLPAERTDRRPHQDRKLFGTIDATPRDWTANLSAEEAEAIEVGAAAEMASLGYERRTTVAP